MTIIKPLKETRYQVAITFKTERTPIEALIPVRELRRLRKDFTCGKEIGTYELIMDGHVTEYTFPLQEMDVISAVSEIKDDG